MRSIFNIWLFLVAIACNSQTQFSKGFDDGFKKGYCYQKDLACTSPTPPISPIPSINESPTSYNDGYNRGFKAGIENGEKNLNNSNVSKDNYTTSDPNFIEFVEPNTGKDTAEMTRRYNELKDSYGFVIKHIRDETLVKGNLNRFYILRDAYLLKIKSLIQNFNSYKLEILSNSDSYTEHFSKLSLIVSNFNEEFKELGL